MRAVVFSFFFFKYQIRKRGRGDRVRALEGKSVLV